MSGRHTLGKPGDKLLVSDFKLPSRPMRTLYGDPAAKVKDGIELPDLPGVVIKPLPPEPTAVPAPAAEVPAAEAPTPAAAAAKAAKLGWQLFRRLPGSDVLENEARKFQEAVGTEVRKQLALEPAPSFTEYADSAAHNAQQNGHANGQSHFVITGQLNDAVDPLRGAMGELLERGLHGDKRTAERFLFATILAQLVPDEARILAALSDGTAYPIIDVAAQGKMRRQLGTALRNASTVGKAAGVGSLEHVPAYITRMEGFGLLRIGALDASLARQYGELGNDPLVQKATDEVRKLSDGKPLLLKRTLRLSDFGRAFWLACDPTGAPARSAETALVPVAEKAAAWAV